jgi:trans-aconitate methyltransferase
MSIVREKVVSQFHRPRGLGGRAVGWIMGTRPSNVRRNRWAVDLLDVQPTDRVLEIGFGPGVAIEAFAARTPDGVVCGVDHSDLMVRTAARRNAAAVGEDRVHLEVGEAEDLSGFAPESFDIVFTVNTMMFVADPTAQVERLRALLRPGGTIALVHQPRQEGADEESARRSGVELSALLTAAGFTDVRVETLDLRPPVVAAIGGRSG